MREDYLKEHTREPSEILLNDESDVLFEYVMENVHAVCVAFQ